MNCIIIEDEIPAQRILQSYISKIPEINTIGIYQSALDSNSIITSPTIDCIFLDINLPDISGIQYVKTLPNSPPIIMTTAYPEHAVESFELENICDYLVKPFSFERFLKAVNKCKKGLAASSINEEKNENSILINVDKTLHKIIIEDILYVSSDKNYVTITTKTKKLTYLDSLKIWAQKLPNNRFIQVHKSYIINYTEVEKLSGNLLYIRDRKIPIGRTYRPQILKALKKG